jgi:hypothetical protein
LSAGKHLTYNPLLPGHVVAPLRQIVLRARVHEVRFTGIDTAARRGHYQGDCETGSLGDEALAGVLDENAKTRLAAGTPLPQVDAPTHAA